MLKLICTISLLFLAACNTTSVGSGPLSAGGVSAFPTAFAAQAIARFIDQPSAATLQLREIRQV